MFGRSYGELDLGFRDHSGPSVVEGDDAAKELEESYHNHGALKSRNKKRP